MAEISKITLPSGTTYDIKDATARSQIEALSNYTVYAGVTTSALTDGSTINPIVVGGNNVTAQNGMICTYGSKEFIWNGSAWQEFGDLSALGNLAYSNTASADYTPAGSVSASFTGSSSSVSITATNNVNGNYTPAGSITAGAITVKTAGATETIHNPTKVTVAKTVVAAAPGATAPSNALTYYSVANETLSLYQLGYTTGDSIATSDVTVKTGDAAYESANPTFSGTSVQLSGSTTPSGSVSATFTGTQATIQVSPDA